MLVNLFMRSDPTKKATIVTLNIMTQNKKIIVLHSGSPTHDFLHCTLTYITQHIALLTAHFCVMKCTGTPLLTQVAIAYTNKF